MHASLLVVLVCGLTAMAQEDTGSVGGEERNCRLPESLFAGDKEYVYNYTTQVISGIPEESNTMTGFRISCVATVSINKESQTKDDTLKMTDCDVTVVNKDVSEGNPNLDTFVPIEPLPKGSFESIDTVVKISEGIKKHLSKPVNFEYLEGGIIDIKTTEDDPIWSVNIKKGILSLLKTVTKRNDITKVYTTERPMVSRKPTDEDYSVYRMMESDVLGNCESVYAWSSIRNPYAYTVGDVSKDNVLRVLNLTKSRNYLNCTKEPMTILSMLPENEFIFNDQSRKSVLNSSTHIDYDIKVVPSTESNSESSNEESSSNGSPTDEMYIVERIFARSYHIFAPFSASYGSLTAATLQTLEILEVREGVRYNSKEKVLKATQLEMEIPVLSDLSEEQTKGSIETLKSNVHTLLSKILFEIPMSELSEPREQISHLVHQLVEMLKKCDLSALKAIFEMTKSFKGEGFAHGRSSIPEGKVRDFLIDILPTVGTKHAVRLMKYLLSDETVAMRVLTTLPLLNFLMPPHPSVLSEIENFCETSEMKVSKSSCEKHSRLVYGSLFWNLFSDYEVPLKSHKTPKCLMVADKTSCATKYSEGRTVLRRWLRSGLARERITRFENETLLALQCIADSGLVELIPDLRNCFSGESCSRLNTRVAALYALRRMAKNPSVKESLRLIVLPLYRLPTLDAEIRIAAYHILMETIPTSPYLEMIAHQMNTETSEHVFNYVHSHLSSIATTTLPSYSLIQTDIKMLLASMKTPKSAYPFSGRVHLPLYSEDLELGGSLDFGTVGTPKSFLPRAANVRLSGHIFGKKINLAELIVRAEGLQSMLEKLVGPGSSKWSAPLRSEENCEGEECNKKSDSSETIKDTSSRPVEPLVGQVIVKIFGQHVSFSVINTETIMNWIFGSRKLSGSGSSEKTPFDFASIEQSLSNGIEMNIQKSIILIGRARVNTICGIPLYLNTTLALSVSCDKCKVTVGTTPSLFSSVSETEQSESNLCSSEGKSEYENSKECKIRRLEKFVSNWREELLSRKIVLSLEGNPSIIGMASVSLGADIMELSTMTTIHGAITSDWKNELLSKQVTIDIKKGIVSAQMELPKKRHTVFNATVRPVGLVVVPVTSEYDTNNVILLSRVDVQNSETDTKNVTVYRYYKREPEVNVTSYVTYTPCSDSRSVLKSLPTHIFCGRQSFEVVLHKRSSEESVSILSKAEVNVTFISSGFTFRYPTASERSIESTSSLPRDSDSNDWKFTSSFKLSTSLPNGKRLLGLESSVEAKRVIKERTFSMGSKVYCDMKNEESCSYAPSTTPSGPWESAISMTGRIAVPATEYFPSFSLLDKPLWGNDANIHSNVTICFGKKECDKTDESVRKINVFFNFSKSESQMELEKLWFKLKDSSLFHPNMTTLMTECREEFRKGSGHSAPCFKLWFKLNELSRMEVVIDWSKMSSETYVRHITIQYGEKLMQYIRSMFVGKWSSFYELDYPRPTESQSPSSDICRLTVERDLYSETIDVKLRHEHSSDSMSGYVDKFTGLKPKMPICSPNVYFGFFESCLLSTASNDPSTCLVRHDSMQSFDGSIFSAPLLNKTNEEFLLLKDRSVPKRFEVYYKAMPSNLKNVTLKVQGYEISVVPIGNSKIVNQIVVTDKQSGLKSIVKLETGEYYYAKDVNGTVVIRITRHVKSIVTIYAIRDGITIHTDCEFIWVRPSVFYHNSLAGLCGQGNGDSWDDFTGPNFEIFDPKEPTEFVKSYMTSGVESDLSTPDNKHCREVISIKESTSEVCFGVSTIKKCSSGCNGKRSIKHICIDQSSNTLRTIKSQYGGSISAIESLPERLGDILSHLTEIYKKRERSIEVSSC